MATIKRHKPDNDWCHICGSREHPTADIWYPQNAEHATDEQAAAQRGPDVKYVRICSQCAHAVAMALNAKVSGAGTASAGLPGWQANGETE